MGEGDRDLGNFPHRMRAELESNKQNVKTTTLFKSSESNEWLLFFQK